MIDEFYVRILLILIGFIIGIILTIYITIKFFRGSKNTLKLKLQKDRKELYFYENKNKKHDNLLLVSLIGFSLFDRLIDFLNKEINNPLFNQNLLICLDSIRKKSYNPKLENLKLLLNCILYNQYENINCNEQEIIICIKMIINTMRMLKSNNSLENDKLVGIFDTLFYMQYKFIMSCKFCLNERSYFSPLILPLSMQHLLLTPFGCFIRKTSFECLKCHVDLINENFACHVLYYPLYLIANVEIIDYDSHKFDIFKTKFYLLSYILIGFIILNNKFEEKGLQTIFFKKKDQWYKYQDINVCSVNKNQIVEIFARNKIVLCLYEQEKN